MVTRASSARACRPDPDVRRPVRPVVLSSAPIPSHPLPAASLARAGRALCHARFRHLCRSRSGCFLAWLLSIGDGICPTAACLATPQSPWLAGAVAGDGVVTYRQLSSGVGLGRDDMTQRKRNLYLCAPVLGPIFSRAISSSGLQLFL